MPARGQFRLNVEEDQVFGRLRVIRNLRRYRIADGDIRYRVLCLRSCGAKTRVSKFELLRGDTTSCGCAQRELLARRNQDDPPTTTHGATSKNATPALRRTFSSWKAAKARVSNPNGKDHHLYYDRGIKMCRRWFNSFAAFLADMKLRPENKTLDRKNPDKNYTPSNCRWADATTQSSNKRKKVAVCETGRLQESLWCGSGRISKGRPILSCDADCGDEIL
jgi:hypothetical protein